MKSAFRKAALACLAWGMLIGTIQGPVQPSLSWLHGKWRGDASIQNRPAKSSLSFQPTLADTALSVDFTLDAPAIGDEPPIRVEAHAIYRLSPDGSVVGQWSDSIGNFYQASGEVSDDVLIINLFDEQNQVAQVGYEIYADGGMRSGYWAKSEGQLTPFIQGMYRKVR